MKRHFALPAALALTLLAFLLFGFAKATVPVQVPPKMIQTEYVFPQLPPDRPVELEETKKSSSQTPPPPAQPEPLDLADVAQPSVPFVPLRPPLPAAPPHEQMMIDPRVGLMGEGHGVADGLGPQAIDANLLDRHPRTRVQLPPAYPAAARVAGLSGEVIVEFVVDPAGRVHGARIVRSSDPMFDEPTLRAVSKWQFEPGTKGNRSVSFRLIVPVIYKLGD